MPNYTRGRVKEDHGSKPAPSKKVTETPISITTTTTTTEHGDRHLFSQLCGRLVAGLQSLPYLKNN
jgi:hypothetical protein